MVRHRQDLRVVQELQDIDAKVLFKPQMPKAYSVSFPESVLCLQPGRVRLVDRRVLGVLKNYHSCKRSITFRSKTYPAVQEDLQDHHNQVDH